jgi:thiol-disulfide isomerase/thioredoxin
MTKTTRYALLAIILAVIVGAILYLESRRVAPSGEGEQIPLAQNILEKKSKYDPAKEIVNPYGFINTDEKPVTIGEFIGKKIVLVDFWTYSCINCQRTLPYLTAWHDTYNDLGLQIIGIHTPEFEFEKEYANVLSATKQFGIKYPVVQDNDYATWQAYKNRYWPRKYLIDIDGYIVYDHIGEGAYEATEMKIRELLEERQVRLGEDMKLTGNLASDSIEETLPSNMPRTPEIYFGASRNTLMGNGIKGKVGAQTFGLPSRLSKSTLYLDGQFSITAEYAENLNASTRIVLPYQAKNVFIVASADKPVRAQILIGGEIIPKDMRGSDVDENGYVTIQADKLYKLVESNTWKDDTLTIEIEEKGVRAFAFTFG